MTRTRKLAAVMFTDIVGYTAMMSRNEYETIGLVGKSRVLHESIVNEHRGEVLEVIGDGTLCCFPSALDAVHCAVDLQRKVAGIPDLCLRVGIHLGDIVFSEGSVYGDGVNVASRIETAGEPGSIHVSEQIFLQIKNRPELHTTCMGPKRFKNIGDPVVVYAIDASADWTDRTDSVNASAAESREFVVPSSSVVSTEWKNAIAVLPFDDMSPGKDNEYFSDGLTEEIIADLSQVKALRVISRTSSMMFKGTNKSLPAVGQELGVQYVLEGSVRKAGNNLRITAQLIDAASDSHLWANKYNGSLDDVFDIQEQVSRAIVEELRLSLSLEEQKAIGHHDVKDVSVRDWLFRARHETIKGTPESFTTAFEYLEAADRASPNNIAVFSAMVEAYFVRFHATGFDPKNTLAKMEELANRILQIDSNSSYGYLCRGMVQYKTPWGFREAAKSFKRATDLQPNNPSMLLMRATLSMYSGQLDIARACSEKVLLLDPISPGNHANLAWIHLFSGDYPAAIQGMETVLASDPDNTLWRWCSITMYAHAGRVEEVNAIAKDIPSAPDSNFARLGLLYDAALRGSKSEVENLVSPELEETARMDETFSWTLAQCCSLLGEIDKALGWLEIAVMYGFVNYPWLSRLDPLLENIRGETRFQDLMDRVRLEWERHGA